MYEPEGVITVHVQVIEGDDPTWREITYRAAETCEHQETMCEECEDTWAEDHNVRLWFEDENGTVNEVRF